MNANGSNTRSKERHEVPLPDGTLVDIDTTEGANAFLTGVSNFDYFSLHLKEIRKLRKKKNLNAQRKKKLEKHYAFIQAIAERADRELFREKIPESEIQDWLSYTIEDFKSLAKKQRWINYGIYDESDHIVLKISHFMLGRHIVPVNLAFENEFFQVLANFLKVRSGENKQDGNICGFVGKIAAFTLVTGARNSLSVDKIFEKFEASGFLEEIIRCSAVPNLETGCMDFVSQYMLDVALGELESCTGILTRKFKRGERCGDTLQAILDGGGGNVNRLKGIARLVETMDTSEFEVGLLSETCSYCSTKSDSGLSCCARCQFVFYCSRECQKADWKTHKCDCRNLSTAELDRVFSLRLNTLRFMNQNFESIFEEMDEIWARTDLEASDLAVEISFMPDDSGIIPALHSPPIFGIVPIRDYASGTLPVPEWFQECWDTDLQRTWLKDLATKMETECKSTSGVLVVHHAGRICVDIETIGRYRESRSCLDDIKMNLGPDWCSPPVSMCQKCPDLVDHLG